MKTINEAAETLMPRLESRLERSLLVSCKLSSDMWRARRSESRRESHSHGSTFMLD